MWLTRQLNRPKPSRFTDGTVTGGSRLDIRAEREYRNPQTVLPYGFSSVPAPGERAVLLEGRLAGVAGTAGTDLEEGEVRLYSRGGAEIVLKNSGEVCINGQVFAPREGG